MPNHIHGIIIIVGAGPRVCPESESGPRACPECYPDDVSQLPQIGQPSQMGQPHQIGQPQGVAPTLSLPDVVCRFKTMTTKRYTDRVKQNRWALFPGKLWQRNYYEHIIRNEKELNGIREYIIDNPLSWEMDEIFRD